LLVAAAAFTVCIHAISGHRRGCARSGTTLLRVILDAHPHIACGAETSLLIGSFLPDRLAERFDVPVSEVWRLRAETQDHVQLAEQFFSDYAARRGKRRWAEKTPQNVRHIGFLFRHFPASKFIHVIRDGRDVVCSLRTHPRYRMVNGVKTPTNICRPLAPCVHEWLRDTAAGMRWRGCPNYTEVRYEDLLAEPEGTLRRLCEFIGEPWDPRMLEYHHLDKDASSRNVVHFITSARAVEPLTAQAVQRWRTDLNPDEQQLVHQLAGARLLELGYAVDSPTPRGELAVSR